VLVLVVVVVVVVVVVEVVMVALVLAVVLLLLLVMEVVEPAEVSPCTELLERTLELISSLSPTLLENCGCVRVEVGAFDDLDVLHGFVGESVGRVEGDFEGDVERARFK
jgi:hypothetical protein